MGSVEAWCQGFTEDDELKALCQDLAEDIELNRCVFCTVQGDPKPVTIQGHKQLCCQACKNACAGDDCRNYEKEVETDRYFVTKEFIHIPPGYATSVLIREDENKFWFFVCSSPRLCEKIKKEYTSVVRPPFDYKLTLKYCSKTKKPCVFRDGRHLCPGASQGDSDKLSNKRSDGDQLPFSTFPGAAHNCDILCSTCKLVLMKSEDIVQFQWAQNTLSVDAMHKGHGKADYMNRVLGSGHTENLKTASGEHAYETSLRTVRKSLKKCELTMLFCGKCGNCKGYYYAGFDYLNDESVQGHDKINKRMKEKTVVLMQDTPPHYRNSEGKKQELWNGHLSFAPQEGLPPKHNDDYDRDYEEKVKGSYFRRREDIIYTCFENQNRLDEILEGPYIGSSIKHIALDVLYDKKCGFKKEVIRIINDYSEMKRMEKQRMELGTNQDDELADNIKGLEKMMCKIVLDASPSKRMKNGGR
mmetsp:Transcript_12424/g.26589  ORF Transcript_12424/g.26589 Transcript_12424/m.26589 type:complete len:471 (-) Transcript_12424:373-1785(-)